MLAVFFWLLGFSFGVSAGKCHHCNKPAEDYLCRECFYKDSVPGSSGLRAQKNDTADRSDAKTDRSTVSILDVRKFPEMSQESVMVYDTSRPELMLELPPEFEGITSKYPESREGVVAAFFAGLSPKEIAEQFVSQINPVQEISEQCFQEVEGSLFPDTPFVEFPVENNAALEVSYKSDTYDMDNLKETELFFFTFFSKVIFNAGIKAQPITLTVVQAIWKYFAFELDKELKDNGWKMEAIATNINSNFKSDPYLSISQYTIHLIDESLTKKRDIYQTSPVRMVFSHLPEDEMNSLGLPDTPHGEAFMFGLIMPADREQGSDSKMIFTLYGKIEASENILTEWHYLPNLVHRAISIINDIEPNLGPIVVHFYEFKKE